MIKTELSKKEERELFKNEDKAKINIKAYKSAKLEKTLKDINNLDLNKITERDLLQAILCVNIKIYELLKDKEI